MTDVNIWNRSLTDTEVMEWTQCKMDKGGNLLDWSTAEWTAFGLEEVWVDKEEICKKKSESQLIGLDMKWNFEETLAFCGSVLGGEMAVVIDNKTAQEMVAARNAVGEENCGTYFYSGYSDARK